jgi:hypothetical protein
MLARNGDGLNLCEDRGEAGVDLGADKQRLSSRPPQKPQAYELFYGSMPMPIALVVPDAVYPGMWRIQWPISDLGKRVRDAALTIAERSVPSGNRRLLRWKRIAGEAVGSPLARFPSKNDSSGGASWAR